MSKPPILTSRPYGTGWADTLRDLVAASADDGRPVTVPDPGTEHGRRLLHTLGADTTVTMTLAEYVELLDRAVGRP